MGVNSDPPSDQHPPYQGGKGGSAPPLSRGEGGINILIKLGLIHESIPKVGLIHELTLLWGKGGSAPLSRGESTKIKFELESIADLNLITDFIRLRIVNKIKYN